MRLKLFIHIYGIINKRARSIICYEKAKPVDKLIYIYKDIDRALEKAC